LRTLHSCEATAEAFGIDYKKCWQRGPPFPPQGGRWPPHKGSGWKAWAPRGTFRNRFTWICRVITNGRRQDGRSAQSAEGSSQSAESSSRNMDKRQRKSCRVRIAHPTQHRLEACATNLFRNRAKVDPALIGFSRGRYRLTLPEFRAFVQGTGRFRYQAFSDAISITKRYFTSLFSMRSYASLIS
jgi:hypothetical protein